jgi:hypothetical protein
LAAAATSLTGEVPSKLLSADLLEAVDEDEFTVPPESRSSSTTTTTAIVKWAKWARFGADHHR